MYETCEICEICEKCELCMKHVKYVKCVKYVKYANGLRTLISHERTSVHFLVLPASLVSFTEITEYTY